MDTAMPQPKVEASGSVSDSPDPSPVTEFTSMYPMHGEVFLRQQQQTADPTFAPVNLRGRISAISFEGDGGEKYVIRLGNGEELVVGKHEIDSDIT